MFDYLIGGVIVVLIVLALRSLLFKKQEDGCAGCPYSKGCQKKAQKEQK